MATVQTGRSRFVAVMAAGLVAVAAALVLLMASVVPAYAESGSCGENAEYVLDDNGVLTITGKAQGASIAREAFKNRDDIYEIEIGYTIGSLGMWCFQGCTNLKSVTFSSSHTELDQYAFRGCTSLTDIELGNEVTVLPTGVFSGCTSLKTLHIPDSVKTIESSAFSYSGVLSMTIPDSVTTMGGNAFYGCPSLETVVLGNGLTKVEDFAFDNCPALQIAILPEKLETLGEFSFNGCENLVALEFPESLTTIEQFALYGAKNLVVCCTGPGPSNVESGNYYTLIANHKDPVEKADAVIFGKVCEVPGIAVDRCVDGHYCNFHAVEPTGHIWGTSSEVIAPTCTEQGWTQNTCVRCGELDKYNFTEALGHNWGGYVSDGNATCEEDGTLSRTCSRCKVKDDPIPDPGSALGHSWKSRVITAPTCTEVGEGELYCKHEGCTKTVSYEIDALGHNIVQHEAQEPTCTEAGWDAYEACSRCDYSTYKEIEALGHDYKSVVTEPTCTEDGFTTHTCTRCSDSYTDSETEALGHDFKDYVSDGNADCTHDGTKTAKCTRCQATNTVADEGSALGHKWSEWTPVSTDASKEQRTCSVCKATETRPVESTPLSADDIALSADTYTYSGKANTPAVTVKVNGKTLVKGTDYAVTYYNNVYAGQGEVSVAGKGNYTGTVTKHFTINPLDIASSAAAAKMTLSTTAYQCNGKAKKPAVTVTATVGGASKILMGGKTVDGVAIKLTYPTGTQVGTYTVKATGTRNYTGTITKTYKINPAKSYMKRLTPGKGTLTWTSTSRPAHKSGDTYQVQFRRYGTTAWKWGTSSKTYYGKIGTSTKLAKGKKYQVRIRAVKTVNGTKYYGAWSTAKLSPAVK